MTRESYFKTSDIYNYLVNSEKGHAAKLFKEHSISAKDVVSYKDAHLFFGSYFGTIFGDAMFKVMECNVVQFMPIDPVKKETKANLKLSIEVEVLTNKPIDEVKDAIRKGIYRGLDTPPNYIAPPKDVTIEFGVTIKVN